MTDALDTPPVCHVALLGYGTVGTSIHQLLVEHRQHIHHATGREVDVTSALVRNASRPRPRAKLEDAMVEMKLFDEPDKLFAARPDLICEVLGGLEPARTLVLRALDAGIPVVTANKQLVARHGTELFAAAAASGTQLRFEASVCGAIPIVRMLRESLAAARIDEVLGILNGTTNFMLGGMIDDGMGYDEALAQAQELGYAEPDPTDDVNGSDAAAKLAILAGIAFHTRASIDDITTSGITGLTSDDATYAAALNCRIKLIGRAQRTETGMLLDVAPTMVPLNHPLSPVSGATNAVLVRGATFRELMVQGPGAGGPETASAIAGDIVGVLGSTPSFLTRDPALGNLPVEDARLRPQPHYVRLLVDDQPGVLASVAGAFATRGISIERVMQQRSDAGHATLVLVTHPCARADIDVALEADGADHSEQSVLAILEETR